MTTSQKKDFYNTLGLKNTATKNQIDAAYQSLSSKFHPDKNPNDRVGSQRRFNDITEAYINLSNPARRHQYDVLTTSNYNIEDAYKVFDRFYEDRGIYSQEEKSFFTKHFPQKKKSYYEILGVRRNAPLDEIKRAYKKLALKNHPRANPGDKQAEERFLEVSDAFNHLSEPTKRSIYDVSLSGEIKPNVAHNIYQGYNALKESQNRALHNLHPETEYAESYNESTFTQKTPHGVVGKTVRHKSSVENGKKTSVATQQVLHHDGTREVTETTNEGGKVSTRKYHLNKGEQMPRITQEDRKQIKN